MMLNRTSSGAQKKIRQRKEEKNQFQNRTLTVLPTNITTVQASTSFSSLSNSTCDLQSNAFIENNSKNSTINSFCKNFNNYPNMDYRSMVDLYEYRSILPEDNCSDKKNLWKNDENSNEYERNNNISSTSLRFMQSSDIEYLSSNTNNNDSIKKLKSNLSSSKLNEKPCRPPRNADLSQKILNRNTNFEHKKSFSSSIYDSQTTNLNENIYKTLNNLNFCDSEETRESNSNGYNFGKPTVQVYPMQVSNSNVNKIVDSFFPSNSSNLPIETSRNFTPPPIPKKNKQFEKFKATSQEFESLPLIWTSKTAFNKSNSNNFSSNNYEPKPASPSLNCEKTFLNSNNNEDSENTFNYSQKKLDNIVNSKSNTFHTVKSYNDSYKNDSKDFKTSDQLSSLKLNKNLYNTNQILSESKNLNLNNDLLQAQNLPKIKSISYSPSLINLKNSLNHAFFNREKHSEEELNDLEDKRLETIKTLSKKINEQKIDLDMVEQDLEKIDEFRLSIFNALNARGDNTNLLTRLEIHIFEGTHLAELDTRIQIQLEKFNNCDKESYSYLSFIDEQFIEKQKQRLQQQSNDLQDIKVAFNQRDNELDAEINVALDFDNSILNEWRYYLSIKHKLNIERKQIEEYIQNANKQLNALQKMSIFNKIKNNC